jgi:uncharacterized protein (DUF1499 family)
MFGLTAVGVATTGYFMSLSGAALFVLSVAMLRLAVTDYKLPVLIILIAALIAFVALLLSAGALAFGQISQLNLQRSIIALVLSAAIFVPVFLAGRALEGVPLINDIMTDVDNPPQFVVVPTQRKAIDNSLELSEKRLAFHQKHYGDMKPLIVDGAADAHFDKALALIAARGWTLVSQDRAKGIIEATEATVLFGFKDDVVIRLSTEAGKTRIDMRSASRQGQSDFRVNAKRIEAFLADLKTAIAE